MSTFNDSQINGAYPIQDLAIVKTANATPPTRPGGYASASRDTPSGEGVHIGAYVASLNNNQIITTPYLASYGRTWGLTFDADGNLYVAQNLGSYMYITRLEAAAAIKYVIDTASSPSTVAIKQTWQKVLYETFTTQVGMAIGDGWLFLGAPRQSANPPAGWSGGYSANTITTVIAMSLETGEIRNLTPMFLAQRIPAATANRWMAWCNGILCCGYAANTGLDFYDTRANVLGDPALAGNASLLAAGTVPNPYDIRDIATDGNNRFFILTANGSTNGNLYVYDLTGTQRANASVNWTATSLAYDAYSQRLLVSYSGHSVDFEWFNPYTLASIQTGTKGWSGGTTGVSTNGDGGFHYAVPNAGYLFGYHASAINPYSGDSGPNTGYVVPLVPRHLATWTSSPGTELAVRVLTVSRGTVKRVTSTQAFTLTNGTSALQAGTPRIFSAQLGNNLYYADGSSFKYYDAATDSVKTLTATAGSLPVDSAGNPPRLIEAWRNRLVWSGLLLDPFNWFMSAVDGPGDYNYAPTTPTETQAVAGSSSVAGKALDAITSFMPYNDEILGVGCLGSLFQMTGDPASGGRIDLVSDGTGVAFGRPWCKSPDGIIYFFGSLGAIYRWVPGSLPVAISGSNRYLFAGTDLAANVVRMVWNDRQRGFHVFISPITSASTFHYFYDAAKDAWWKDQFNDGDMDPFTVAIDQDLTGPRLVLVGSRNGYVRTLDYTAKDDDGEPIYSSCVMGPIRAPQNVGVTVTDAQIVLDAASTTIRWGVKVGYSAEQALIAKAVAAGFVTGGRNRSQAVRAYGHAAYFELASLGKLNSTWALEAANLVVQISEGRTRQRIF